MNVTLATPANMDAARIRARQPISAPGLFAWSEFTGERYSANPGDYWNYPQDKPLLDSKGNPMVLVTETVSIKPFVL